MSYGTTRISTAEILRRQRFLEQVNDAYAALRADPGTWKAVLAERQTWDATSIDGLAVAETRAPYEVSSYSMLKSTRPDVVAFAFLSVTTMRTS